MSPEEEKQEYVESLKGHSDRELLEIQTYYARKTYEETRSLDTKLTFFYSLTIISLIIYGIYTYNTWKDHGVPENVNNIIQKDHE
jgi:hypothetical protein